MVGSHTILIARDSGFEPLSTSGRAQRALRGCRHHPADGTSDLLAAACPRTAKLSDAWAWLPIAARAIAATFAVQLEGVTISMERSPSLVNFDSQ
jgi:hypothetical protein